MNLDATDVPPRSRRGVRLRHLWSGQWFHHLLVEYLRRYDARRPEGVTVDVRDPLDAAERVIRSACAKAAVMGTGAAAVNTGAALWAAQAQGLTVVVALPMAGAAVFADLVARALLHLRMTCDVASLFGVRLDPDDPADIARLYAIALGTVEPHDERDPRGLELLERLVPLGSEEASGPVGATLANETALRDVLPVVGVLASGAASWRVTRRLGEASVRYARSRRALDGAVAPLEELAPGAMDLLIEGIWFVLTADGRLDGNEATLLAHLLHLRPALVRATLLARLRDDESGWLERLREVPVAARRSFLQVLHVAAALDTEVLDTERALLERAARALEEPAPVGVADSIASHLKSSGLSPPL